MEFVEEDQTQGDELMRYQVRRFPGTMEFSKLTFSTSKTTKDGQLEELSQLVYALELLIVAHKSVMSNKELDQEIGL